MAKHKETPTAPRVSVLERRLQNPFGEPSVNIRFKRPDITGRWFNDGVRGSGGQIHRGRELGWLDVTPDMIADMETVGFHTVNPANQITRGARGEEVLMFMPTADFKAIQWAKTKKNYELTRDFAGQKAAIAEAAAQKFGSEAGDYLDANLGGGSGYVKDTHERIQRMQEPGDA